MNKNEASNGHDREIFTSNDFYLRRICEAPVAVDVSRVDGEPIKARLDCGYSGCLCDDTMQSGGVKCSDYMVRFLCPCREKKGKFYNKHFLLSPSI